MGEPTYDSIVVGLGGMGSATLCELARRGLRVLGLEQFSLVHDRGSSHGQTRIIRQAYYEHPDYVPLVRRAYERWYDLEQRQEVHLLTTCDCLSLGKPDSELIAGVQRSANEHQIAIHSLDVSELGRRYPQFRLADNYVGLVEPTAGFLYVERCVQAYLDEARQLGATIHAEEAVLDWQATSAAVEVRTAHSVYHAARLVLTVGPWAPQLLAQIGVPLTVMRQAALWFKTADDRQFRRDRFPIYIADTEAGYFYGFPALDRHGAKVAQHYGAPELRTESEIEPEYQVGDELAVREFLKRHLPALDGPLQRSSICRYTLTPDRHFVIDCHPEYRHVAFAAGFSGHGFKFASVVGEILADLAERGRTALPIERFAIRGR